MKRILTATPPIGGRLPASKAGLRRSTRCGVRVAVTPAPARLKGAFAGSNDALLPQIMAVLQVLDEYLTTGVKPAAFTDRCVAANGALIAAGDDVWNGILDDQAPGACTAAFPIHASSRMVAGDSFPGDMFKCELKPLN